MQRSLRSLRYLSNSSHRPDSDVISSLREELARQKALLQRHEELLKAVSPAVHQQPEENSASATSAKTPTPSRKSPRGFMDFKRQAEPYRQEKQRIRDWGEIARPDGHADKAELKRQAARCMDW